MKLLRDLRAVVTNCPKNAASIIMLLTFSLQWGFLGVSIPTFLNILSKKQFLIKLDIFLDKTIAKYFI